jgi:putative tryptophan/tyrosine transport system substrate-binding protein
LKKAVLLSILVVVVQLAGGVRAEAQQPTKVPRIGMLLALSPEESTDINGLRQGLTALGYVEGKNLAIEYRYAEGKLDRLPALAAELVDLKVDVIVALNPPSAHAAKNATKTIPIVMRSTDDPVTTGLVASLARPGGNITGLTSISTELIGKRLEILKETVPHGRLVAVLRNPTAPDAALKLKETEVVGRALGLQFQSVEVRALDEFESAFKTATRTHPQALIVLRNPLIVNNRMRIADLASKSKLPAMYDDREFVDAGGLMSYGADLTDLHRRAAVYVDKILKGAKPADLPVEQPMKFEFIINLKAARQIGLTIPPDVLARADKVIR